MTMILLLCRVIKTFWSNETNRPDWLAEKYSASLTVPMLKYKCSCAILIIRLSL